MSGLIWQDDQKMKISCKPLMEEDRGRIHETPLHGILRYHSQKLMSNLKLRYPNHQKDKIPHQKMPSLKI